MLNFFKKMTNITTPDYLSSIATRNSGKDFEFIGKVSEHLNGEVHSDIFLKYPELDVNEAIQRDNFYLPSTVDRELYHGARHYDWWLSGLLDYLKIKDAINKYKTPLKQGDAFYEMGCASGRVLRHFSAQENEIEVWGSDINSRHIEWMRLNLAHNIKIFQNTILPQLPIESGSIDVACAFSVFTHIDDLDFAWLAEIRRILKKDGIFYVTIHSEDTWKNLKPDHQIYINLLAMAPQIIDYKIDENFLAGPLPKDKTVFKWPANNYNTNVFHTKSYVLREWARFFDVKEIIPAGSAYQDVVILQKA
jgi:SAM-dependent methyltransferase